MAIDLHGRTFKILGDSPSDRAVPADKFATALLDWVRAHTLTAKAIDRTRTIEWDVVALQVGSAEALLAPRLAHPLDQIVADDTEQRVDRAFERISRGLSPGSEIPERAGDALKRVAVVARSERIGGIEAGYAGNPIHVGRNGHVPTRARPPDRVPSSVEGELVQVSFAQNPIFGIRDRVTGSLVSCNFDEDRFFGVVQSALKARVLVSGTVTYRTDGTPTNITDVDEIRVFPPDDELPSIDDVAGIDPDFTGGLSSEEWVRRQRD